MKTRSRPEVIRMTCSKGICFIVSSFYCLSVKRLGSLAYQVFKYYVYPQETKVCNIYLYNIIIINTQLCHTVSHHINHCTVLISHCGDKIHLNVRQYCVLLIKSITIIGIIQSTRIIPAKTQHIYVSVRVTQTNHFRTLYILFKVRIMINRCNWSDFWVRSFCEACKQTWQRQSSILSLAILYICLDTFSGKWHIGSDGLFVISDSSPSPPELPHNYVHNKTWWGYLLSRFTSAARWLRWLRFGCDAGDLWFGFPEGGHIIGLKHETFIYAECLF